MSVGYCVLGGGMRGVCVWLCFGMCVRGGGWGVGWFVFVGRRVGGGVVVCFFFQAEVGMRGRCLWLE